MDERIEMLDPIHVAGVSYVGAYEDVGPFFDRLFRWAGSIGVLTGRVLTLSWDYPEAVAPKKLRWGACVELRTAEEPRAGIVLDTVSGIRHAVYRLTGPYEGIARAYGRLFEKWLSASGKSMGEGARMELYRHAKGDRSPEKLVTDLCVPSAEQPVGRRPCDGERSAGRPTRGWYRTTMVGFVGRVPDGLP